MDKSPARKGGIARGKSHMEESTSVTLPHMGKIVAIGGGDMRSNETALIDKELIRLTGKKHPRLLFLPTASNDSEGYWDTVRTHFGKALGCKTDVLFLRKEKPTQTEMKQKILSADIVYVGGGNTLSMMRLWRKTGVDLLLRQAYARNIVLCGVSAGSICWFTSGHSDSLSFYHPEKWDYIRVRGLGLLQGIHCPHYDSHTLGVPRKKYFHDMIQKTGGIGIALENNCALECVDDTYRIIASQPHAKAYKVYRKNGKVFTTVLAQKKTFSPISTLYTKNPPPSALEP